MEDRDCKPYCEEGESESHVAIAWAMVAGTIAIFAWLLFLWAIGVIEPFA